MLTITIPAIELYDEAKSEFFTEPEIRLDMEHSLVSLSKWESEFEKPFLTPDPKSTEEAIGYIRAMTLSPDIPAEVYQRLSAADFTKINDYIEAKMTATWFNDRGVAKKLGSEVVTAELIYYWMFANQIEKECENWHLRRLITLIEVFSKKNEPPKKMSTSEIAARNRELNARRKAELHTKG